MTFCDSQQYVYRVLSDRYRKRIIAHRGVHSKGVAKNSMESFRIAAVEGFGLETDIRDHVGDVLISHDPITSIHAPSLADLCELEFKGPVALNVKSDGLLNLDVVGIVGDRLIDYFYFDHSIPELVSYINRGLPVAQRVSNLEELRFENVYEVWFDNFVQFKAQSQCNLKALLENHRVHIVSPELHGRNHLDLWSDVLPLFAEFPNLTICTDLPFELLVALEKQNV